MAKSISKTRSSLCCKKTKNWRRKILNWNFSSKNKQNQQKVLLVLLKNKKILKKKNLTPSKLNNLTLIKARTKAPYDTQVSESHSLWLMKKLKKKSMKMKRVAYSAAVSLHQVFQSKLKVIFYSISLKGLNHRIKHEVSLKKPKVLKEKRRQNSRYLI